MTECSRLSRRASIDFNDLPRKKHTDIEPKPERDLLQLGGVDLAIYAAMNETKNKDLYLGFV